MCHEALQWIDFKGDEIEGLCFKTEQHNMQEGVKKFGGEGKISTMKDVRNLSIKNDCFGELKYDSLTKKMKQKMSYLETHGP